LLTVLEICIALAGIVLAAVAIGRADKSSHTVTTNNYVVKGSVFSSLVLPTVRPRLIKYAAMGDWAGFPQNTPGFCTTFPDPSRNPVATTSPTWYIAGWWISFVQIPASTTYTMPSTGHINYIVVLSGTLFVNGVSVTNIPAPRLSSASARVDSTTVTAGSSAVIIALFRTDPGTMNVKVTNMTAVAYSPARDTKAMGVAATTLEWFQFKPFNVYDCGNDFYNMRGFEVYDSTSRRIAYVQFWASGMDNSGGWHNHSTETSATTFGELLFLLVKGQPGGGIQLGDQSESILSPNEGDLVGPLWLSQSLGSPVRVEGLIMYPNYRWVSLTNDLKSMYDIYATIQLYDI
jgi:hypothetical protein